MATVFAHGSSHRDSSVLHFSALERQAVMHDPSNPYASPMSSSMDPAAAQWLGDRSPSLMRVATGLGLVYASVLIIMLAIVGGGIAGGIIGAGAGDANKVDLAIAQHRSLFMGILVLGIIGRLIYLLGSAFCVATPAEARAKEFISVSVATMIIAIVIQIAIVMQIVPDKLQPVQLILMVASWLTFMYFLRRIAEFVGRPDFVSRAGSTLALTWVLAVVIAGILGITLLARAPVNPGQGNGMLALIGLLGIAGLICGLIAVVKFASLVKDVRKVILSGGQDSGDGFRRPS